MPRIPVAVTLAAVVLAATTALAGGGGLPDLVPTIDFRFGAPWVERHASVPLADLAEGCAGGPTDRSLLRFTLTTENVGTADLVLGDPGCPDCELFPGPTCENPLYECSPVDGHGHGHFSQYALYEVLPERGADAVAAGRKQGFCLEDTLCEHQVYTCEFQGLSLGCQDIYPYILGCQYVDVTGLPGGRYVLRATVNYAALLPELDYDNNVVEVAVDVCEPIAGPRGILRRREPPHLAEDLRWQLKGRTLVQAGFGQPDPRRDGARLRIETDGERLVDLEIPGRPGSGHCGPKDGWKRARRTWVYRNQSGFLDRECTVPANGLRVLRVRLRTRKSSPGIWRLRYAIAGRTAFAANPTRLRTTLVLGADTGPCWTGATACSTRCQSDSADGAFAP